MVQLNKRLIDSFVNEKETDIRWDDEVKGLGVRIYASNKKSFVFRYSLHTGRTKRSMVIGAYGVYTLKQARDEARRLKYEVSKGGDPAKERKQFKDAPTVSDLCTRYLEEHASPNKKPKSADDDRRAINNHIKPRLKSRLVSDVSFEDISKLHHSLKSSPFAANRVVALLSKMFNLAEKWGHRGRNTNPCRGIERYPEPKRVRYPSQKELKDFGNAIVKVEANCRVDPTPLSAIKILLFTAGRKREILSCKWEYIDFERKEIRLPDSKSGPSKIPLNEVAIEILEAIGPKQSGWVFPSKVTDSHWNNIDKTWKVLVDEAGIENFRIHDLRHAFASAGANNRIPLEVLGTILRHSDPKLTKRYSHIYDETTKQAANTIGNNLKNSLAGI